MTTADNIRRLDDAQSGRAQPLPIDKTALHKEAQARRDIVLDRLAVVRVSRIKNGEQMAAIEENNAALNAEQVELEQIADAMLSEIHAFDRIGQGR